MYTLEWLSLSGGWVVYGEFPTYRDAASLRWFFGTDNCRVLNPKGEVVPWAEE